LRAPSPVVTISTSMSPPFFEGLLDEARDVLFVVTTSTCVRVAPRAVMRGSRESVARSDSGACCTGAPISMVVTRLHGTEWEFLVRDVTVKFWVTVERTARPRGNGAPGRKFPADAIGSRGHDQYRETSGPQPGPEAAQRWAPSVLLLVFIGSGCRPSYTKSSGFQLLQLSIGSSAVSLGVLLGIYMGGMFLGKHPPPSTSTRAPSVCGSTRRSSSDWPFRRDRAVCGTPSRPAVHANAGTGQVNLVLRAVVAAICLLPRRSDGGHAARHCAAGCTPHQGWSAGLGYFYGATLPEPSREAFWPVSTAAGLRHAHHDRRSGGAQMSSSPASHTSLAARHSSHRHHVGREAPLVPAPAEGTRLVYVAIGPLWADRNSVLRSCGRASCRCSSAPRFIRFR